MDMEQLKTFCHIVELRSFSRTAVALHVSQPTVSVRIRSLESELGQQLLKRQGKEIILTAAGESFYKYAKQILEAATEARRTMKEFAPASQVSIASTPMCTHYVIPEIWPNLITHPDFSSVSIRTTGQQHLLIDMFSKGIVDVALFTASSYPKSANMELLWYEPTVLVTPPDHPLASQGEVQLRDLQGHPFVSLKPDVEIDHYGNKIVSYIEQEGLEIHPVLVVDHIDIAKTLIRKNSMISFLPLLSVEEELARGELAKVCYHLPDNMDNGVYLFTRYGNNVDFISHLRSLLLRYGENRIKTIPLVGEANSMN